MALAFYQAYRERNAPQYPTVRVTVPEGYTVSRIDALLAREGVVSPGSLLTLPVSEFIPAHPFLAGAPSLEGFLFPDTYEFFLGSSPSVVASTMLDTFSRKALPLFPDPSLVLRGVTLASIIEREVPPYGVDRSTVAGIFEKRLRLGMPLQADATVCYAKDPLGCGGVSASDLAIESPYNTYRVPGLPPGPIANPGASAIAAALAPRTSPYLYYISHPETGRSIFAGSLDEHTQNVAHYLK